MIVTTYEMILHSKTEMSDLSRVFWRVMIVDEAHRYFIYLFLFLFFVFSCFFVSLCFLNIFSFSPKTD